MAVSLRHGDEEVCSQERRGRAITPPTAAFEGGYKIPGCRSCPKKWYCGCMRGLGSPMWARRRIRVNLAKQPGAYVTAERAAQLWVSRTSLSPSLAFSLSLSLYGAITPMDLVWRGGSVMWIPAELIISSDSLTWYFCESGRNSCIVYRSTRTVEQLYPPRRAYPSQSTIDVAESSRHRSFASETGSCSCGELAALAARVRIRRLLQLR